MTTSTDYITEQEFLDYIKTKAEPGNDVVQTAISAASRSVDAYCDRFFYIVEGASLTYDPDLLNSTSLVRIHDLADDTDLEVKTDSGGDGTYATTLTQDVDFVLEDANRNALEGWPFCALRSTSSLVFPVPVTPWRARTVQVTGNFGWAAVPSDVKQATKILASQLHKLADAPLGVAGYGAYGEIRVRDIPQAARLLNRYRSGSAFGVA